MYIDYAGRLKFCGCTQKDMFITDMVNNKSEDILNSYLNYNKNFSRWNCEARNPTQNIENLEIVNLWKT